MKPANNVNWRVVIGAALVLLSLFVTLVFFGNILSPTPLQLGPNTATASAEATAAGFWPTQPVRHAEVANATPAPAGALVIARWAPNGTLVPKPVSLEGATALSAQPGWVLVQLASGPQVWIEQKDAVGRVADPPTPPAVQVVVFTPATPAPAPCETAGTDGQTVTLCDWDSDLAARVQAAWVARFGGNAGTSTTVTPYPTETDFYTTPPHVDPTAQQALIGSDPDALACDGSVICGGLTNAQAQAELDRQRATREALPPTVTK